MRKRAQIRKTENDSPRQHRNRLPLHRKEARSYAGDASGCNCRCIFDEANICLATRRTADRSIESRGSLSKLNGSYSKSRFPLHRTTSTEMRAQNVSQRVCTDYYSIPQEFYNLISGNSLKYFKTARKRFIKKFGRNSENRKYM